MAVETKQGGTAQTTPQNVAGAAQAANGKRRKRTSSLLQTAGTLPSVETSLDEFIARANSTLLDAANWDSAEKQAKQDDADRREADQLRWQAAEQQLRESEAREQSLRRQLDGLQGKLAEAEARAAVAAGTGSHDGVIADLKVRLQRADEAARIAHSRAEQLQIELASKPAAAPVPAYFGQNTEDAEERARIAEAKAAKAIAAAKAASAGLNVAGEIAAIESGLVVPEFHPQKKGGNALVVGIAALLVGAAVMFAVTKVLDKNNEQSAPAAAAQVQPAPAAAAPAPAPAAAPAKPVVTPIEEPAPAPAQEAAKAPEPAAAPAPAPETAKVEPAPAPAPAPAPKAPAVHHAAPAIVHHAAPAKAPAAKAPEGGLADPFASPPAPAAKKSAPKADKKAAGGAIVDPF